MRPRPARWTRWGRTFIAPEESGRGRLVRLKLNPVAQAVQGKRVVLIDDSIVRGTTSERIVRMIRGAGASEVHVRIASPMFLHPCYYGTDVDSGEHLIARTHTTEEIAHLIGADSLGFLSIEDALRLVPDRSPDSYCAACFRGDYPAGVPEIAEKNRFEVS